MSTALIDSYPTIQTTTTPIQSTNLYNSIMSQYATIQQQQQQQQQQQHSSQNPTACPNQPSPPHMQSQPTQPQTPPIPVQQQSQMTLGTLLQVCHKLLDYPLNNINLLMSHDILTQLNAVEAGLNTAITTYPHLTQQLEPYIKSVKHKKQQIEVLLHQARRQQQIQVQQQQQHQQQYNIQQQQQQIYQQQQQQQQQPYPQQHNHQLGGAPTLPVHHPSSQPPSHQHLQYASHPLPDSTTLTVTLDRLMFHPPGNRYLKIRKLRATLFGHVSLYKDTLTGDLVAVKLSSKELMIKRVTAKGKPVSENPLDEMRFMRKLNEPLNKNNIENDTHNILSGAKYVLRLLDECDDGSNIWTVLEFAQEGELFDYVEQCDGRLDSNLVRRLFIEMVYGVQYMHIQGICHLDLSLENLLLTGDHDMPDVKICDFGLARFLQYDMNTHHELPYAPAVGRYNNSLYTYSSATDKLL